MQVPTNADFRSLSDVGTVLHERTLNGGVIWRWGRAAPRKWRYKLTKSTFLRAGRALELVFRAGWGRGFLGDISSLY